MLKRYLVSVLVVFLLWSALDFVIHSVILGAEYQATAALWRPFEQMKLGLTYLSTLIAAGAFAGIYMLLVSPKSVKAGIVFGLLIGLFSGVPMSLGSYSVMPITVSIAGVWFLGMMIETILAGLCVAAILKDNK